jgi:A-factor biosynthesis hotdog domain
VSNAPSDARLQQRELSSTPESAWLRFDRNVSRDLVHRAALAEVLIADTVQVADDEFLLGTQLPRAHTLWSDRQHSYHDPLITVEICRQACLAIPQRYYDVGPDWQFVSKHIDFAVVNLKAFADNLLSPPEGVLRARFSNRRERHGVLCGLTVGSVLSIDGTSASTVDGDLMFFPKDEYEQMRDQQRTCKPLESARLPIVTRRIDPARIGRILHRNVAIGESSTVGLTAGECRYTVVVDQTQPSFFDHPLDHLPGALVIEIYRQAAIATATVGGAASPASAIVTRCDVQLFDFAEFEAPVECSASVLDEPPHERVQIALALHQFDTKIGDAHVELDFTSVGLSG